ncbi:hypothetical protein IE81DRAFT_369249 [Ceraceosorus guamensis]|uniref:dynamin GTPase n=1 Tax=Ceraceosorus guamensis TaxID=1522189 RepID=A0A316VNM9_9BASI|nr:hypothetical protein IE81DRAFT_369249 [Ceraceosorus guamensis]PWN39239.1 hypothetical protein IE81DRAFT_369249 [Ceraceosorus guamensis]
MSALARLSRLSAQRNVVANRLASPRNNSLFRPQARLNRAFLPLENAALARGIHVRAISFSSVPRAALRAFRVPAYAFGAAGGALAYANYKVDEFRGFMGGVLDSATTKAGDLAETLGIYGSDAASAVNGGLADLSKGASELGEGFKEWWASVEAKQRARQEAAEANSGGGGGDRQPSEGDEEPNNGGPAGAAAALAATLLGKAADDEKESEQEGNGPQANSTTAELQQLTRKLIEVRNILKSVDHADDTLTLPSMVVIGSQSSGKSSVLEAIVGHEFLPKGSNMVTRRPIELTLVRTEPTRASRGTPVEYGEFPGLGLGRITDFRAVQKTLFDLNMAVPAAQCVSDEPIELRIHSPHVPDLTMIDLPGYVQIAGMDQPEELREKISTLCEKYIREPNIILAVCAADVDLANSPALRASRKVDPLGLRTIGVVTKLDLVPPEEGAAILRNNKYPLALGYVGVVCKGMTSAFRTSRGHDGVSGEGNVTRSVLQGENDYFSQHAEHYLAANVRGRNAGQAPLTGTETLRRRLMAVLEESMGSSLHGIANAVQIELEEAAYQFKVQYNDRSISAESYVAETMDALKARFKDLAAGFGKPEVRSLLRTAFDDKVMDILAQMYWTDARASELSQLADNKKLTAQDLDRYWQYKLDASTSALTKSGIGRLSTQLVADAVRAHIDGLASAEPFNHHPDAAERIAGFASAILRERFGITADQVENCVKPYKYEVEVEQVEWEDGRRRSIDLLDKELRMCDEALKRIQKAVGSKRLREAEAHVKSVEERSRKAALARLRAREGAADAADPATSDALLEESDPTQPHYNSALLAKARESTFLADRSAILKMRAAALRAKRCKTGGPEAKAFCPEAFLSVVADKLAYTSVMFINIELLAEFFYQFPREIDSHLIYDLGKEEISRFARENPDVRKHLDLQERKEKLEMVMEKLDALVKVYQEKQAPQRNSSSKWGFF